MRLLLVSTFFVLAFTNFAQKTRTISFYNGTANSDPSIILLPVPAAANQGAFFLLIPGEGILAQDGVYVEIGTAASVIVIYG
jgi:hypothetical protein